MKRETKKGCQKKTKKKGGVRLNASCDCKTLRYSRSALELVSESTHSDLHLHTHLHAHEHAHIGRIEYESIAALAGCVPAVTALMLAAADGSVQSGQTDRSEEEREAETTTDTKRCR